MLYDDCWKNRTPGVQVAEICKLVGFKLFEVSELLYNPLIIQPTGNNDFDSMIFTYAPMTEEIAQKLEQLFGHFTKDFFMEMQTKWQDWCKENDGFVPTIEFPFFIMP